MTAATLPGSPHAFQRGRRVLQTLFFGLLILLLRGSRRHQNLVRNGGFLEADGEQPAGWTTERWRSDPRHDLRLGEGRPAGSAR